MNHSLLFSTEQLFWVEELSPDWFVEVRAQRWGDGEFDERATLMRSVLPLRGLPALKESRARDNLWRSWCVYRDRAKRDVVGPVPLILDIDDESVPPNLDHAHELTLACLDALEFESDWVGSLERLRVVFSGRKGFHIEVKPAAPVNAQVVRGQLLRSLNLWAQEKQVPTFANTFFEKASLRLFTYEWVRLSQTVHSWRDEAGQIRNRRICRMRPTEFRDAPLERILAVAEEG